MATIKKQGRGYKITVSCGYGLDGKQIRQHMTWVPDPGMTARQTEKELQRQAVLFEERVKHGKRSADGNIRFEAFVQIFLSDYARLYLKAKTVHSYETNLKKLMPGIGHFKLKEIQPVHIAALYRNLQEAGMRDPSKSTAVMKVDFEAWMKENSTCMARISRDYNVSIWAIKRAKERLPISVTNAKVIAGVMGKPVDTVFTINYDMTPLAPVTIHSYHRVLSAVFHQAVKWGYIEQNPAASADLPSLAGYHANYLDDTEARHLLELLQDEPIKWRAVTSFDLMSGLRRAELLGLRWTDVDLDKQLLYVRQTWNYTPQRGCYADTPKNRSSERPLRISRTAVAILREYKVWQDHQREIMGDAWMDRDNRIFTRDDGQPMFPDSISQWFHKFVKRNGLPDVHIHSLRHTYASLMIAEGTPLVVVSHNLGHAQVSTTSNIYSHVIASAEAQADAVFDRYADAVGTKSKKEEGGQTSA